MAEQIIVKLDSQILNSMDLCPERYNLEHIENWRPQAKDKALEMGSVVHRMLAHYYAQKKIGRVDLEAHVVVEECVMMARVYGSTLNLAVDDVNEEIIPTFKEYITKWQYDGWEILSVEQPFSKILFEARDLVIMWEGVVDLRARDPKVGEIVIDHKSEHRKSYPFVLGNQFQGYEWAFGLPVIVNKVGFQSSLTPQERFRRLILQSGTQAIDEWKEDTIQRVIEAIGWHATIAAGGRLRKNRTSCDKYSGCIFQRVCKDPPENRQYKLQAYFYKDKPWDPYNRTDVDDAETVGATE